MIPQLLTFFIVKSIQIVVKRLGKGGGTALPGLIAYRLNKQLLSTLARQLDGTVVVVGTNGKTTTSRMVASFIEGSGKTIIHNRSGSNMTRGVMSTLIAQASWRMKVSADWGIFEVDEAYFPELSVLLKPRYVVMLNLFRDQLDRYGEVSALAETWKSAVRQLDASTTVIFNTDDPSILHVVKDSQVTAIGYGVNRPDKRTRKPAMIADYADSRLCPSCGASLDFTTVHYSHLGIYACPNCDFVRPTPQFAVSHYELDGMQGSYFRFYDGRQTEHFKLPIAGLYNIYNATAALSLARLMEIDYSTLKTRTENVQAAFGRLEEVKLPHCNLVLILVKNPTGFNQVIDTLISKPEAYALWMILNDNIADGRDVSWIWDVELEKLSDHAQHVIAGGTRAYDMALRVKYAQVAESGLSIAPSLAEGLRIATSLKQPTVYCLCTYTAMLQLRRLLQKNQVVQSYHAD